MIRAEPLSHYAARANFLSTDIADPGSLDSSSPVPDLMPLPKVIPFRNPYLLIQVGIDEPPERTLLEPRTFSKDLVQAFYSHQLPLLSKKLIYAVLVVALKDRNEEVTFERLMARRHGSRDRLVVREADMQTLGSISWGTFSNIEYGPVQSLPADSFPSDRLVRYVCNAIRQYRLEDEEVLRQVRSEESSGVQIAKSSSVTHNAGAASGDMQTARNIIKTSINRLLVTIGDSLESSREKIKLLTRDRKFLPQVSRAILMRIPVNPEDTTPFLHLLCIELYGVAQGGNYGNDSGRVIISDEEMGVGRPLNYENRVNQERTDTKWVRATVRSRQT